MREMEKTRGFMGGAPAGDFAEFAQTARSPPTANAGAGAGEGASSSSAANQGLTDEQMQMFEEGNQDMMDHYESTLDKVR